MIFPRYSALLALVLFANSCSKDSPVTESEITPDPIFAMMATDSPPDEATNPRVRPQVDKCDCFISIESLQLDLFGQPITGPYAFFTDTNYECSDDCDLVSAFYDTSNCESPFDCLVDYSNQVPWQTIDFLCPVERNGTTQYEVGIYGYAPNLPTTCDPIENTSGRMTFRIRCSESAPSSTCLSGGGYSFVSDLFSVTFTELSPGFNIGFTGSFEFVMGGECGCTAIEI